MCEMGILIMLPEEVHEMICKIKDVEDDGSDPLKSLLINAVKNGKVIQGRLGEKPEAAGFSEEENSRGLH